MTRHHRTLVADLRLSPTPVAIGVAALCLLNTTVHAVEIKTDNTDLEIRLDTTLRYNAAWRTQGLDPNVVGGAAPSYSVGGTDEGNYTWKKGKMTISRVDMYNEFDVTYKKDLGLRVSASAWYDNNFPDRTINGPGGASGTRAPGAPNYTNNEFTPYVKRYYEGPSGEFNDAFVWSNFNVGGVETNLKLGRFAFLPGEYVFGNGGSVSFSMSPNDGQKSDLSPGASAKETALPLGQIGATVQVNSSVSLFANYSLEFRSSRISEGGTFNAVSDAGLFGPQWISGGAIPRAPAFKGEKGDIALGLKWQPEALDGDAIGLWYRKFDDKNPTWATQLDRSTGSLLGRAVYAKDIELLGLTYNTSLAGWATGVELNYRRNMPLAVPSSIINGVTPGYSDPNLEGPRGETMHFLLSGVKLFSKNALFDTASLAAQFDYNRIQKITSHADRFNGALSGVTGRCVDNEVLRGCGTRTGASIAMSFTPTWQQVAPSLDVSMPLLLLYGLKGNSGIAGAGTLPQSSYLVRIGARFEYLSGQTKHQFDLAYTTRDGKKGVLPGQPSGVATTYSGLANLRDRDYISLTYQTAF